jgi:hypothetical protein
MKKIVLGLSLFMSTFAFAQNGLEKIIVEKYYVANAADKAVADVEASDATYPTGSLPVGAVTYRVYADMLPGFRVLSIYADVTRNQPLIIKSTTPFYNNPNGASTASSTKASLKNKILALDSYFTMGGAGTNVYGILKTDDDATANNITTAGNADSILINKAPTTMGISLVDRDGLFSKSGLANPVAPSFVGFDNNEMDAVGDGSVLIDSVVSMTGVIYTPNGAKGADSLTNRVLLAQLTTGGKLQFHLNILIQKGTEVGQYYVWGNPQPGDTQRPDDILFQGLNYPDSTATGIVDIPKKAYNDILFSVYPNPANDQVTMDFTAIEPNSKGNYTIYGLLGNVIAHKELHTMTGPQKEVVDISSFSQGLYTIQLNINGITSTKKIIKN